MNTPDLVRVPVSPRARISAFARFLAAISALLVFVASPSLQAQTPVGVPGAWTLTYQDEFNGSSLDGARWRLGTHFEGIQGLAGNSRRNISVSGGTLKLKAEQRAQSYGGNSYSYATGEVSTLSTVTTGAGKLGFSQRYGFFEVRARWDLATGLWPAFWLMPDRGYYGPQSTGIPAGETEPWGGFERSYLKFAAGSGSPSSVTSAILRLKLAALQTPAPTTNKPNVVVMGVPDDSWTETGINWNNMPVPDPLWHAQSYNNLAVGSYVDFDVTALVAAQAAAGDKTYGFCLADTFMKSNRVTYHSREAAASADRPVLLINGVAYSATADAMVSAGSYANTNYGTSPVLKIRDHYYNTANTATDSYGQGMEIDVMETLGIWGNNMTTHAIHWDGYGAAHQAAGWGPSPAYGTDTAFHTFGLYWAEGVLEFYVDGVKTGEQRDARVSNVPAFVILSLQLGGWDGNTPSAAVHNKQLEIDYLRVWSGSKADDIPAATSRLADGSVSLGRDSGAYGTNASPKVTLADEGLAVAASKDGWFKFPLAYTVTPDTVLEFTVESVAVGQIIGIGLDADNDPANQKRVFQLAGSETSANLWTDFKNYAQNGGPKTYSIPVGAYYTGPVSYLVLVNDNDSGNNAVSARFSGIRLHDGLQAVNFSAAEGYANGTLHDQPGSAPAWKLVSGSNSFNVDLTKGLVVNGAQTAAQNAVWQTPVDHAAVPSRTAVLDFEFTQSASSGGTATAVSLGYFQNSVSGNANVRAYFGRAAGTDAYRIGFYQNNGTPATSVTANVSGASIGLNSAGGDNVSAPLQLRYTLVRGANASSWTALVELKNRSTGATVASVNVPAFATSASFYDDTSLYPAISSESRQSAAMSEFVITGYTSP